MSRTGYFLISKTSLKTKHLVLAVVGGLSNPGLEHHTKYGS
jgi:hypothetical protein